MTILWPAAAAAAADVWTVLPSWTNPEVVWYRMPTRWQTSVTAGFDQDCDTQAWTRIRNAVRTCGTQDEDPEVVWTAMVTVSEMLR